MISNASRWLELLAEALQILDAVPEGKLPSSPPWTLGGGTALALQIDHRISYDIDLFVPGASLMAFRPPANEAAAVLTARPDVRWQHPGHYLKYELPIGEIDFLSPALQTENGWSTIEIAGRDVAIETPVEIVVKKVRYRAGKLKARDVFDIACVVASGYDLEAAFRSYVPDAVPVASQALDRLYALQGGESVERDVAPTKNGRPHVQNAMSSVRGLFDRVMTVSDVPRP